MLQGDAMRAAFWTVFHTAVDEGPLSIPPRVAGRGKAVRINPGVALSFAADVFGISIEYLLSHSREREPFEARALVVLAMREIGDPWSYPSIGRVLGGRDHSTMIMPIEKHA